MCRVKRRTKETNLSICSWNVGGLISENHNKTKDPLFINHIKEYDLILLTETHLGYENIVDIAVTVFFTTPSVEKSLKTIDILGVLVY